MDRDQRSGRHMDSRRVVDSDGTVSCPRSSERVEVHRCYFCSGAMEIVPTIGLTDGWVRCHSTAPTDSQLERI